MATQGQKNADTARRTHAGPLPFLLQGARFGFHANGFTLGPSLQFLRRRGARCGREGGARATHARSAAPGARARGGRRPPRYRREPLGRACSLRQGAGDAAVSLRDFRARCRRQPDRRCARLSSGAAARTQRLTRTRGHDSLTRPAHPGSGGRKWTSHQISPNSSSDVAFWMRKWFARRKRPTLLNLRSSAAAQRSSAPTSSGFARRKLRRRQRPTAL